jgi:hypothetical protein
VIADSMGLGKTLQTLTALDVFLDPARQISTCDARRRTALIVIPTTVLHNWKREIHHWFPDRAYMRPLILSATEAPSLDARVRLLQRWQQTGGVLLVGFELFRRMAADALPLASDRTDCLQMLQQSQLKKRDQSSADDDNDPSGKRRRVDESMCERDFHDFHALACAHRFDERAERASGHSDYRRAVCDALLVPGLIL